MTKDEKIKEVMELFNSACEASWNADEAYAYGDDAVFSDLDAKRCTAMDVFESKLRELIQ